MKTCLLNLPYPSKIIRRYNCTYHAPNFLLPPMELMYLGAIIEEWKKDSCILIDAIAEGLNLDKVIKGIKDYQPDLLVFMAGVETLNEDLAAAGQIKSNFPALKITCLGLLPSVSPGETLKNNPAIDYIIMNEPEISFSELYDCLKEKKDVSCAIPGIAYRINSDVVISKKRDRIKDLDTLPFPRRSLIKNNLYSEFMMPKPLATIQTMRGCPFECSFCVSTYGREVSCRNAENVLEEIEEAVLKYKVKAIRFMDDTFTLDNARVIKLCGLIKKKNLKFTWSCLSRVDTLSEEMLKAMKESGCRRIYLGIESSTQRILDFYKKGYRASLIESVVGMVKKNNIEAAGFFIVGGLESEEEFRKDLSLAKKLKLDYIIVEKISFYPGTALFKLAKDINLSKQALIWEKIFYRSFYLRPEYIIIKLVTFIFNLKGAFKGAKRLSSFTAGEFSSAPRPEII